MPGVLTFCVILRYREVQYQGGLRSTVGACIMTMPLVLYCGDYCESAYGHLFFCYSCGVVASRLVVRFVVHLCFSFPLGCCLG